MILVIGGIKGGSGKTTLATNLAVLRTLNERDKKVLLIDTDEQRSASDWVEQRTAFESDTPWTTIQLFGKAIHNEIQKLSTHYDDIIIDAGGRETFSQRSVLTIADKFLIPFRPKSLDVWTIGKVSHLISEATSLNKKLQTFAVINQADFNGNDNKDAHEALSEFQDLTCFDFFLGYRKAFSTAAAKGLAVNEIRPIDKKAVQEMNLLYLSIYN